MSFSIENLMTNSVQNPTRVKDKEQCELTLAVIRFSNWITAINNKKESKEYSDYKASLTSSKESVMDVYTINENKVGTGKITLVFGNEVLGHVDEFQKNEKMNEKTKNLNMAILELGRAFKSRFATERTDIEIEYNRLDGMSKPQIKALETRIESLNLKNAEEKSIEGQIETLKILTGRMGKGEYAYLCLDKFKKKEIKYAWDRFVTFIPGESLTGSNKEKKVLGADLPVIKDELIKPFLDEAGIEIDNDLSVLEKLFLLREKAEEMAAEETKTRGAWSRWIANKAALFNAGLISAAFIRYYNSGKTNNNTAGLLMAPAVIPAFLFLGIETSRSSVQIFFNEFFSLRTKETYIGIGIRTVMCLLIFGAGGTFVDVLSYLATDFLRMGLTELALGIVRKMTGLQQSSWAHMFLKFVFNMLTFYTVFVPSGVFTGEVWLDKIFNLNPITDGFAAASDVYSESGIGGLVKEIFRILTLQDPEKAPIPFRDVEDMTSKLRLSELPINKNRMVDPSRLRGSAEPVCRLLEDVKDGVYYDVTPWLLLDRNLDNIASKIRVERGTTVTKLDALAALCTGNSYAERLKEGISGEGIKENIPWARIIDSGYRKMNMISKHSVDGVLSSKCQEGLRQVTQNVTTADTIGQQKIFMHAAARLVDIGEITEYPNIKNELTKAASDILTDFGSYDSQPGFWEQLTSLFGTMDNRLNASFKDMTLLEKLTTGAAVYTAAQSGHLSTILTGWAASVIVPSFLGTSAIIVSIYLLWKFGGPLAKFFSRNTKTTSGLPVSGESSSYYKRPIKEEEAVEIDNLKRLKPGYSESEAGSDVGIDQEQEFTQRPTELEDVERTGPSSIEDFFGMVKSLMSFAAKIQPAESSGKIANLILYGRKTKKYRSTLARLLEKIPADLSQDDPLVLYLRAQTSDAISPDTSVLEAGTSEEIVLGFAPDEPVFSVDSFKQELENDDAAFSAASWLFLGKNPADIDADPEKIQRDLALFVDAYMIDSILVNPLQKPTQS